VLDVLLNKAREIHKALGTYVPVPDESESVTQAVLQALFLRRRTGDTEQLQLDLGLEVPEQVAAMHRRWDRDVERERTNRTRFAQRALKPADVRQELEATDAVLGDPDAVRSFLIEAAQRLGLALSRDRRHDVFRIAISPEATAALPDAIRFALPAIKSGQWLVSFVSPTPEGAEYLGRNHRFVAALARFLNQFDRTRRAHPPYRHRHRRHDKAVLRISGAEQATRRSRWFRKRGARFPGGRPPGHVLQNHHFRRGEPDGAEPDRIPHPAFCATA
jgi:hypothetical protein